MTSKNPNPWYRIPCEAVRVKAGAQNVVYTRDVTGSNYTIHALDSDVYVKNPSPIPMVLFCPNCGMQHIDAPARDSHAPCATCSAPPAAPCYGSCTAWTNPSHRSHLCAGCTHVWRPADVPTTGVEAIATRGKNDSAIVVPYRCVVAAISELITAKIGQIEMPNTANEREVEKRIKELSSALDDYERAILAHAEGSS